MVKLELPRRVLLRPHQLRRAEMRVTDNDRMAELVGRSKEDAARATEGSHAQHGVVAEADRVRVVYERAGGRFRDQIRAAKKEPALSLMLRLDARESRSVAPRRDLRQQRRSNANELEAAAKARQADVVGGHPEACAAEQPLGLIDRLPALLERREVPSPASGANDPEPTLFRIERQPSANREGRQKVIGGEIRVTKQTGRVHGRVLVD